MSQYRLPADLERLLRQMQADARGIGRTVHAVGGDLAVAKTIAAEVAAVQTRNVTTYGDLTTVGPDVTVPSSGSYFIQLGAYMRNSTATAGAFMSVQIGAVAAADTEAAQVDSAGVSLGANAAAGYVRTLTAGTLLRAKYRASAGTATFGRRWLAITPL